MRFSLKCITGLVDIPYRSESSFAGLRLGSLSPLADPVSRAFPRLYPNGKSPDLPDSPHRCLHRASYAG